MKWFGRDPAMAVAEINVAVLSTLLLFRLPDVLTAAIGGVVTAVGGLIVAAVVKREGTLAALVAVGRTAVTLAVVLGVDWDPAYQILLIAAFENVAGIFIRDRVVAPIDSAGIRRSDAAVRDAM